MRFANSVTLQSDYTTDRAETDAAIDNLVAKGQTELYKATAAAAVKVAQATSSRRVVILLTDGAQDAIITDVTPDNALNAAIDSGVPFYHDRAGQPGRRRPVPHRPRPADERPLSRSADAVRRSAACTPASASSSAASTS